MLSGALIAGATDLTYSLPGYIWVTICAISTAMYLLLIRALKDSTGDSMSGPLKSHTDLDSSTLNYQYMTSGTDTEHSFCSHADAHLMLHILCKCAGLTESSLLYHNNVLSLPIMASYMLIATNEVQTVQEYPQLNNIWFLVSLSLFLDHSCLLQLIHI